MRNNQQHAGRVDWVDYAKGFCIVFVVMMHSTLGVEGAAGREGFMHALVAFARPFRMPDFFMISGLFLGLVIGRDWRTYLDRKVVHFAYFYFLWMTIQFLFKAPGIAAEHGTAEVVRLYLLSFIDPFGTLWFIYLLPIFFIVTKLTRDVPPWAIWIVAAVLQSAPIETGWTVIDEFAGRFVYFYTGYWLAKHVFALAAGVQAKPLLALAGLALWALVNGSLVYCGYAQLPGVSLALGLVGAGAVVSISALFAKSRAFDPLRYCGEHSIVVYLAFFLPMATTRSVLLKLWPTGDVGVMAIIITAAGVLCALGLYWLTRNTPLRFLFERPQAFWLAPKQRAVLLPAE